MIRDPKLHCLIACLLPAAMPAAAAEAPQVGRMFFTPTQRAQLDVARAQRARATLATENTEEAATAAPVAQSLTYDGVVRRADGSTTIWINSRPVNPNDPAGPVIVGRVRADGGVSLQMPQSGRTVDLKPGQSVELLSGQIEERFARKSAPPEPKPAVKPVPETKPTARSAVSERARPEDERRGEDREQTRPEEAAGRTSQGAAGANTGAASISERPR